MKHIAQKIAFLLLSIALVASSAFAQPPVCNSHEYGGPDVAGTIMLNDMETFTTQGGDVYDVTLESVDVANGYRAVFEINGYRFTYDSGDIHRLTDESDFATAFIGVDRAEFCIVQTRSEGNLRLGGIFAGHNENSGNVEITITNTGDETFVGTPQLNLVVYDEENEYNQYPFGDAIFSRAMGSPQITLTPGESYVWKSVDQLGANAVTLPNNGEEYWLVAHVDPYNAYREINTEDNKMVQNSHVVNNGANPQPTPVTPQVNYLPDLTIDGMWASGDVNYVQTNEIVRVTFSLKNNGLGTANGWSLSYRPEGPGEHTYHSQVTDIRAPNFGATIAPGESAEGHLYVKYTQPGVYRLRIYADDQNNIQETNEHNNYRDIFITVRDPAQENVAGTPELALESIGSTRPTQGADSIRAIVKNVGSGTFSGNFQLNVVVYANEEEFLQYPFGNKIFDRAMGLHHMTLHPGETYEWHSLDQLGDVIDLPDEYIYVAHVDPYNSLGEANTQDNKMIQPVGINYNPNWNNDLPDFAVERLTVSNMYPKVGQTVDVKFLIKNVGSGTAQYDPGVTVYCDSENAASAVRTYINYPAFAVQPIAPGSEVTGVFSCRYDEAGTYTIKVVHDQDNRIQETYEENYYLTNVYVQEEWVPTPIQQPAQPEVYYNLADGYTLQDYPKIFLNNNNHMFDAIIVVGHEAPAEDVVTSVNLVQAVDQNFEVKVGAAKLDRDVRNVKQNMVAIGDDDINTVIEEINDIYNNFFERELNNRHSAYLVLTDLGGKLQVTIYGQDPELRRMAGKVLANSWDYDLRGTVVEVQKRYDGGIRTRVLTHHPTRNGVVEEPVYNPPTPPAFFGEPIEECEGCVTDENQCVNIGLRLVTDDSPVYCAIDKSIQHQKGEGQSCQNNFECLSNQCYDGVCSSLREELEKTREDLQETRSVVDYLVNFLSRLFG